MRKIMFLLVVGIMLSTTVNADKIKYYSATTSFVKEMGKDGTASSTFYYAPATVVSAVIETVLAPSVWFWNLFQEEESKEK